MKQVKLGQVVDVFNGHAFKSSQYTDQGHQVIRIANVQDGYISNKNQKFIQLENDSLNRFILKPKDLLISLTGNVGRVGKITKQNLPAVLNQRVGKLNIDKSKIYTEYLYYFFRNEKTLQSLVKKGKGIAQKNIGPNDIKDLIIPLVSLDEQKNISDTLDRADSLRKKRQQAIDLLDEYLKSVFLDMFGVNAKGFEKWPTIKLKDLSLAKKGSMRTGPFGSNLKHSEFVDSGIAVIGIDNAVQNRFAWDKRRYITQKKYEELKRYTLYPRDVIITIMGTTGRSAVIPDDIPLSINTKHLAALTLDPKLVNPFFISYSMYSNPSVIRQIMDRNRGAVMPGLNLGIIKDLNIKTPPIDLQNKFELELHKVDDLKEKMRIQLEEMSNQFNALMQQFFKVD